MGECLCDEDGPCREHQDLREAFSGGVRELHQFGVIPSIEHGPPIVDIALQKALLKGVAAQLRTLADVLDPPEVS